MLKKLSFLVVAAFVVMLFSSINASAKDVKKTRGGKKAASQTACAKTTDDELTKTIRETLAAEYGKQMRHINVSVKNRTVTLEGWFDGKPAVLKAISIVKKTKCVRRVISRLKERGGGSCGQGQKPCGDTCISTRSKCTIDGQ